MIRRSALFALFVVVAGLMSVPGWSKSEDEYTRLARISYLEGNVSFQHDSEVDWSAASINLPLEPGDRVYVGPNSRAEIQFEDGSTFRMAENTDIEILSLREDLIQLRIMLGLATLTVSGDADFEVNTPAAAFNAVRDGIYRFDVVESGDTDAIVRKGELEAANNEYSGRIRSGRLFHFTPREREPEVSLYDRRDEWDEWNDRRNADLYARANVRRLPEGVYMGVSELDRYGRWVTVSSYGAAWVPFGVDAAWSPYSVGRWCYRPLFGWTWISYEPWGWLPYHYGRWYRNPIYGWCWLPGPSFSFHFWSPALVSFYSGPSWVSWCPLGPGDYYDVRHYHYRRGIYQHHLAELRRLHSRRPGDHFNRDVRGAFRTVHIDHFRDGSFDRDNLRNTRWGNLERPWKEGVLVRDRLDIKPSSKSYSANTLRAASRPRSASVLPAVVRTQPQRESVSRGRFDRITNPQIQAVSPGRARGIADVKDDREPSNAAPRSVGQQQERGRILESRGAANRGERRENAVGTQPSAPEGRSLAADPSRNDRSPSRFRIERGATERQNSPQRTQEAAPENRAGQPARNAGEPRPGIGRWSDSGAPKINSGRIQIYNPPDAGSQGRWTRSNPDSSATPSYTPPSSSSGRKLESNSGSSARSAESGRWRQSSPSTERGGGARTGNVPSRSSGNSGGRGAQSRSGGNPGRR